MCRKETDTMNREKEQRAIQYLKTFEPESEPYYLCYSGGKDSDAIRILAELAGVKFDLEHNHTTVDAPETVYYVRSIPGIHINYPEMSMWQLIVKNKIPPTRLVRYCCKELKEKGGNGRKKVTGVRWEESTNRKNSAGFVRILGKPKTVQKLADEQKIEYQITRQGGLVLNDDNSETRRFVEHCYRTTSTMVNPIVDWTDKDVWEFLHFYGCQSNPLYQCGEKRIGCIGCPMQGSRGMKNHFARYPKYRAAYVRAFDRMVKAREAEGIKNRVWKDGEAVMKWWLNDDPNQITLLDYAQENEMDL